MRNSIPFNLGRQTNYITIDEIAEVLAGLDAFETAMVLDRADEIAKSDPARYAKFKADTVEIIREKQEELARCEAEAVLGLLRTIFGDENIIVLGFDEDGQRADFPFPNFNAFGGKDA